MFKKIILWAVVVSLNTSVLFADEKNLIENKVKEILAKEKNISAKMIKTTDLLKEDLKIDFDSLEVTKFIWALEETFSIELDSDKVENEIATVADVIKLVEEAKKNPEKYAPPPTSPRQQLIGVIGFIGLFGAIVGGFIILIEAFRMSYTQGFLTILVPLYMFYFAFCKYKSNKKPIILSLLLGGLALAILCGRIY